MSIFVECLISQHLKEEVKDLEGKFCRLTRTLLQKLKKENKTVDDLTSIISSLPGDIKNYVYDSWLNIIDQSSFKTLDALFTRLNADVWTFLDYYLVHYIIGELGYQSLSLEMDTYVNLIKKFKERTTLMQLITSWKGHPQNLSNYQRVKLKTAKENITLAELDILREGFGQNFFPSLSKCASCIYYDHFDPGCCIVTLLFPVQLATILKQNFVACSWLRKFDICFISVEDVLLYEKPLQSGM